MRHPVAEVAQSNQKKEGCHIILYFTLCLYLHTLKYDLQVRIKKMRERERERERENEDYARGIERLPVRWKLF